MSKINKVLYNVDQTPDTVAAERRMARKNIGLDEVIGHATTDDDTGIAPLGKNGIVPAEYLPNAFRLTEGLYSIKPEGVQMRLICGDTSSGASVGIYKENGTAIAWPSSSTATKLGYLAPAFASGATGKMLVVDNGKVVWSDIHTGLLRYVSTTLSTEWMNDGNACKCVLDLSGGNNTFYEDCRITIPSETNENYDGGFTIELGRLEQMEAPNVELQLQVNNLSSHNAGKHCEVNVRYTLSDSPDISRFAKCMTGIGTGGVITYPAVTSLEEYHISIRGGHFFITT